MRGAYGHYYRRRGAIRHSVEIAALLSIMASGYLAPALVWSAADRTLQLSPCEEASDDEEVIDCDHLKPFSVADAGIVPR